MGIEPLPHVHGVTSVAAVQADGGQAFDRQVAERTERPLLAVAAERRRRLVALRRQRPPAVAAVSGDDHRAEVVLLRVVDAASSGDALVDLRALGQHPEAGKTKTPSYRQHQ